MKVNKNLLKCLSKSFLFFLLKVLLVTLAISLFWNLCILWIVEMSSGIRLRCCHSSKNKWIRSTWSTYRSVQTPTFPRVTWLIPFVLRYLWNFTSINVGGFYILRSNPRCEKCCLACGYRCKGGAVHLKNQVTLRLMTASESLMCCSGLKIEFNAHHIGADTKSLPALEKKRFHEYWSSAVVGKLRLCRREIPVCFFEMRSDFRWGL